MCGSMRDVNPSARRRLHPRALASLGATVGVVVLLGVPPRVLGTSWDPVAALGGDPLVVAAAVLLYRGFVHLLEIPVGGLGILGWLLARSRTAAAA